MKLPRLLHTAVLSRTSSTRFDQSRINPTKGVNTHTGGTNRVQSYTPSIALQWFVLTRRFRAKRIEIPGQGKQGEHFDFSCGTCIDDILANGKGRFRVELCSHVRKINQVPRYSMKLTIEGF